MKQYPRYAGPSSPLSVYWFQEDLWVRMWVTCWRLVKCPWYLMRSQSAWMEFASTCNLHTSPPPLEDRRGWSCGASPGSSLGSKWPWAACCSCCCSSSRSWHCSSPRGRAPYSVSRSDGLPRSPVGTTCGPCRTAPWRSGSAPGTCIWPWCWGRAGLGDAGDNSSKTGRPGWERAAPERRWSTGWRPATSEDQRSNWVRTTHTQVETKVHFLGLAECFFPCSYTCLCCCASPALPLWSHLPIHCLHLKQHHRTLWLLTSCRCIFKSCSLHSSADF